MTLLAIVYVSVKRTTSSTDSWSWCTILPFLTSIKLLQRPYYYSIQIEMTFFCYSIITDLFCENDKPIQKGSTTSCRKLKALLKIRNSERNQQSPFAV